MKLNISRGLCAALFAAGACSMPAAAQQLVGGKVIYGTDDRIDVYQETSAQRRQWAASTCALVSASKLIYDAESDTYTMITSGFNVGGRQPCDGEPFASQPTSAFCSGFAAGVDVIATAGHCVNSGSLPGMRFVFGFQMLDADTPVTTFRGDQVYEGLQVLGRQQVGDLDYAVVQLTQTITAPEVRPLPIRRSGVVAEGAAVGVIGHPSGLPMKIAFGPTTVVHDNTNAGYFTANLDTYGGNSGSPVFDALTGLVEGVLVRGARDYNIVGSCFESNRIADSSSGEDVSKALTFAEFVPQIVGTDFHSADADKNNTISLSEALRVIQFYNASAYHCDASKSEDGYLPGPPEGEIDGECLPHNSDFIEVDYVISLSELLRLIQYYASTGYTFCGEGEDGFCLDMVKAE
ncbi:MAG: trypsin-like serine protease [Candidatus Hydrogenedens sp.]|nr:trypsin-like serine protease [Candidatus Hydrogenedens sp.]